MTQVLLIAFLVSCTAVNALDLNLDETENIDQSSLLDLDLADTENDDQSSFLDKRTGCYDVKSTKSCVLWKSQGHCDGGKYRNWVRENCRKTCGVCSTSKPQEKKCDPNQKDLRECPYYKSEGFCSRTHQYYAYMKSNCPIACGFCHGATTKVTKGVHSVKDECLDAHNSWRAKHGASNLTWDVELAQQAHTWALHLAKFNIMKHSPRDTRKGQGENLAWSWSSSGGYTCSDATKAWYDEVKDYDYRNPGFNSATGHFTQVVWKATRRLGVGIAKNGPNTYVVARYSPPGNFGGPQQYAKNVGRGR